MIQLMPLIASVSIDVDITSAFMAILFVVLLVFLQPIIIKPYLRTRDLREEATAGAREEANEFQVQAENRIEEYEEQLLSARREAAEIRDSMKAQGAAEQNDIIEETRLEISAKLSTERADIQSQVDTARAALEQRAAVLSDAIVAKVLPRA